MSQIESSSSNEDIKIANISPEGYHLDAADHRITVETVLPSWGGRKWYQVAHLRKLVFAVWVISWASCLSGYDGSIFNGLYAEAGFNNAIGNVSGSTLGALSNGMVFGQMICLLPIMGSTSFGSWAVDKFGRKKAIIAGNCIVIVGVIIQSCAGVWKFNYDVDYKKKDVYTMLLVARIIIGIGGTLTGTGAVSLLSEIAYPPFRQVLGVMFNSNWYLGAIVAAWVTYGLKDVTHKDLNWRLPTILQCLFSVLQLIFVPWLVPESPRWYVANGQIEKARDVLVEYHSGGFEEGEALVDYELTEIQLAIEQENIVKTKSSYKELFATAANRKRMWIVLWIGVFMQLSGNGLVSYYLAKVLDSIGYHKTSEQLIINAGLMIFNYGVCLIQSFWIIPYLKQRTLVIKLGVFGMLISFIIWTALSASAQKGDFKNTSMGKGVLAFIFIFYFFYNLGLNGMPILYVSEILPFSIRAKGLSLWNFFQSVVMIYNGFVNPIAMDAIHWKYYLVYVCILAVEFGICFTFVETSGRTLEEVAEVFGDGIENLGAVSGIAVLSDGKKLTKEAQEVEFIE
ncbi:hypothetical protein QEN19_001463 [Hanseniaspora menglaensis]